MADDKGNSGYMNSGNMNSGNRNSGDMNSGNMNSGYFCTGTPCVTLFDLPTTLTFDEADELIPYVELPYLCEWVAIEKMTDHEKASAPSSATTGGFLRVIEKTFQELFSATWKTLDIDVKRRFHRLPNFNADKFLTCTGVDVRLDTDLFPQDATKPDREIVIDGQRFRLVPLDNHTSN